jgi:adenylosuccinate lyase
MRAWKEDLVFRDEVARDAAITALLSPAKLARTFDYTRQLGNVGAIYKRVLGESICEGLQLGGESEMQALRTSHVARI